ncbi:hypothetical protein DL95DRAFT_357391 [Leptodontidium sp. 2 PMI_412]|nr:hypothetical protein BKA61DRAFT_554246 [Leptodontidium sp. MPI-SDFR-AT-0119]KAH9220685.1 hypothetical protein DL95DRAFT_357391 [Leptodontidium sp. 2 PMI_412]
MAQPPTKKLKTSISSFSQPIKITVGPSRTEFHIPKDLLQSEVSQLPLLLDTESQTIKLPREDPDVFVLFATWLTRGSIELCFEFINLDNLNVSPTQDTKAAAALKTQRLDQWHQLVNAYILGDLLGSVAFKNTVMDLLVDKAQVVAKENKMAAEMQHRSLSLIYDSTEAGSPLRRKSSFSPR